MGALITLLTDFGTRDSYVAEVKATLLQGAPDATLIDISHDVPPGDIGAASFVLGRTWHRFSDGAVHLVVVDPGVGSDRRAIAASKSDHAFVGPDNGVLSPILDGSEVVELSVPPSASPTFHGRDVFAPPAAKLARGDPLGHLGRQVKDPVTTPVATPRGVGGDIAGVVVYIDRFGTLITNIPGQRVETDGTCMVGQRDVGPVRRTFADVPPGTVTALVGSGGTVEVAVRDGSAAAVLAERVGTEVRVKAAPP